MRGQKMNDNEFIARLRAEHEIVQVLKRYGRGCDRKDYDLVRAAYHDDAVDDHGPYKGNVDGLLKWMLTNNIRSDQEIHLIGIPFFEFIDEYTAIVETPIVLYHRPDAEVGGLATAKRYVTVLCRFVDRFERRFGEWKIAKRVVAFERITDEPVPSFSEGMRSIEQNFVKAVRGREDPIYKSDRSPSTIGRM
jgi:hypothetical protein